MRDLACHLKRLAILPAMAAALTLAGCGSGVQLEGPGFEALGLTGKKYVEKKVPDRAPLLIPPDPTRLPEPAAQVATTQPQNWPTDPEATLSAEDSEAARKERIYQEKGDWSKKADIDEFEKVMNPELREKGIFSSKPLSDKNRDFKTYEN